MALPAAPDREVLAAPEDGCPRNWTVTGVSGSLNLRTQPSASAPVIARFPAGTILSNLACQHAAGSYATVVATHPDGKQRAIFFVMGLPIDADTSEADPGEFSSSRGADVSIVRVGSERYEIIDAIVLGG